MIKCTNRRSISSIIGGAVFLVLFIAGFTVFMFAIQVSSDRFSEQLSSSFEDTLLGRETFSIAPTIDTSNKLFVQVFNKGPDPLNVQQVFIANVTAGGVSVFDVAFQDSHVAPNERKNVLANHPDNPINITSTGPYDAKVVTEQGTMVTQGFASPLNGLFADLFTIPKNLGSGQNVTVALFVYNRGNSTVFELSPDKITTDMTNPSTAIQDTVGPTPSTVNSLEPQESAFFTWEQQVVGAVGTQISYTNSASGTDGASGDTLTSNEDTSTIEFVPQAISLVQRPEIKIMIPSPSGEENDSAARPIWGVNVINPTTQDIQVSRIIITAVKNSSGNIIFDQSGASPGACDPDPIFPTGGEGTWTCPAENVLMWADITNPITIKGKHMQAFMVQPEASTLGGSGNDPSTNIFVTVYSTYGPATDVGVPTGMGKIGVGGIMNIFMSNVTSGHLTGSDPEVLVQNTVIGNLQGIASGEIFTLIVVLANLSDNADAEVSTGRFVINIPSGFGVGAITDSANFFTGESPATEFTDGSKQISATFTALGAGDDGQVELLTIVLTAPIVTTNATYTIFALAEGETTGAQPIGPIIEFPLQVLDVDCGNPVTTCP